SMIMYLVLGIALLYISEQDDKKNTNNDSNSNNDKRNVSSINSNSSHK
ncbi:IMV membrane protein A9, partial [Monkeypox virus]